MTTLLAAAVALAALAALELVLGRSVRAFLTGRVMPLVTRPETREPAAVEVDEVRAEALPHVLATHPLVRWRCHIAETSRHRHPELVPESPPAVGRPR
jgi:hypothetical protein